LSIARGIAEAQGGTLELDHRDGGGSVFRLRVPAIPTAELEQAAGVLGERDETSNES
jgi:signal transduction histidine kinase